MKRGRCGAFPEAQLVECANRGDRITDAVRALGFNQSRVFKEMKRLGLHDKFKANHAAYYSKREPSPTAITNPAEVTLTPELAMSLGRFWGHVDVGTFFECWNFCGRIRPNGYAYFNVSRREADGTNVRHGTHAAHRIAYLLHFGQIPQGMTVDHTCHNPRCCNPAHLRLCTHSENASKKWFHVLDSRPATLPLHSAWVKPNKKATPDRAAHSPTARDGNGGRDGSEFTESA